MATTTEQAALLNELHHLYRLTSTEIVITSVRRVQARDEAMRTELTQNRDKAKERAAIIAQAIRDSGGLPRVFSPAAGQLSALVKTQVEGATNFVTALVSDLVLEHDLRERARYTRRLAERLGRRDLVPLFERLETAHTATIGWLEQRLAELADGKEPGLRPLPTQAFVGVVQNAVIIPMMRGTEVARRYVSRIRGGAGAQVSTDTAGADGKDRPGVGASATPTPSARAEARKARKTT